MPAYWIAAAYGSATLLALLLLYIFRAQAWYLHAISVLIALAIGMAPIPSQWVSPRTDLIIGACFLFFFLWGVCAPIFMRKGHHHHREKHA